MAQEIEAKFYVASLQDIKQRLDKLGAGVSEPRVLETNLRFDTPNRDLKKVNRVLRLRKDSRARLTYKDSDQMEAGALSRRELEFTVSDFDEAKDMLEALGYELVFIYEKYRTTYKLGDVEIMLDEMPYGSFVEVEGEAASLQSTAEQLGLKWDASIHDTYRGLFDQLQQKKNLGFRDLSFANFERIQVTPQDLGVTPADQ